MKIRNIIAAVLLSICIAVPTEIAVQPVTSTTAADYETASGLIEKCSLSCSDSDGMLKIYAKTQASGIMDKIGFVNIIIQKSSDTKNWTDEKNIGDFLESDKKYYTLNRTEKVSGGFYYRIICTHYAYGLPFRSNSAEIQTASNTSKAVWINPQPITTTTATTKTITTSTTVSTINHNTQSVPIESTSTSTVSATQTSREDNTTLHENKTTSTTTSYEKSMTKRISDDSPLTGANLPASVFTASVIAIVTAIITRKKTEVNKENCR